VVIEEDGEYGGLKGAFIPIQLAISLEETETVILVTAGSPMLDRQQRHTELG
jgi:hypothetical protein